MSMTKKGIEARGNSSPVRFCSVLYKELWKFGTQMNLSQLSHLLLDSYVLCADLSILEKKQKKQKQDG